MTSGDRKGQGTGLKVAMGAAFLLIIVVILLQVFTGTTSADILQPPEGDLTGSGGDDEPGGEASTGSEGWEESDALSIKWDDIPDSAEKGSKIKIASTARDSENRFAGSGTVELQYKKEDGSWETFTETVCSDTDIDFACLVGERRLNLENVPVLKDDSGRRYSHFRALLTVDREGKEVKGKVRITSPLFDVSTSWSKEPPAEIQEEKAFDIEVSVNDDRNERVPGIVILQYAEGGEWKEINRKDCINNNLVHVCTIAASVTPQDDLELSSGFETKEVDFRGLFRRADKEQLTEFKTVGITTTPWQDETTLEAGETIPMPAWKGCAEQVLEYLGDERVSLTVGSSGYTGPADKDPLKKANTKANIDIVSMNDDQLTILPTCPVD